MNFELTYAPVSRSTSLRILLTIAAAHDLEIHQADVERAYLNGKLDRELFMRVPQGYTASTAMSSGSRRHYIDLNSPAESGGKFLATLSTGKASSGARMNGDGANATSMAYKRS